jgi:uncharacterized phiE125 gp8 family phage protein
MFNTGTYKVTTGPSSEPLTLSEVKAFLKVDGSDEDGLITLLIQAARESVEKYCTLALLPQTITEYFGKFEQYGLRLSISPLISVTSVTYTAVGSTTQTLSTDIYGTDTAWTPPLIYRKYNQDFPTIEPGPKSITVTYQAGYANAASVPATLKQAMLLMIADWYDNRQDGVKTMPTASQILLDRFRVWYY